MTKDLTIKFLYDYLKSEFMSQLLLSDGLSINYKDHLLTILTHKEGSPTYIKSFSYLLKEYTKKQQHYLAEIRHDFSKKSEVLDVTRMLSTIYQLNFFLTIGDFDFLLK